MEDESKPITGLQIAGMAIGVIAILVATGAWLMVTVVNSAYHPLSAENWPTYAITTVMWLAFCGILVWLLKRMMRGRIQFKGWIIGVCATAAVLMFAMFATFD